MLKLSFAVAGSVLFALAASAAEMPLMFTDPYLLSLRPSVSMDICWLTSQPGDSWVEYGANETYGTTVAARTYEITGLRTVNDKGDYVVPLKVYQQIARLDGLKPGTQYFYRATTKGASVTKTTNGYFFRTAPDAFMPVKALLLSDLQLKTEIPATVRMAGRQGADLIIYNGDMQNVPYKAGEWFTVPGTPEEDDKRWFNVMQQTAGDTRLLQYVPIYPSPGNHEVDLQEVLNDKKATGRDKMTLGIYMQLFRTLYPDQQSSAGGKHWYSVDFGDLHVVSLSLFRWFAWAANEAPGWYIYDDIKSGSAQYKWLDSDLKAGSGQKYIWVTQHWHMFNRSVDVETPFTDPVPAAGNPNAVTYDKNQDYLVRDLKPLYEKYGVNGVSYGHSHVYERYRINGVNYIEAATIGNNYRADTDPKCSPNTQACPEFEENSFRSFMIVSLDPQTGLSAKGIQASAPAGAKGFVGRIFDQFNIAPALLSTPKASIAGPAAIQAWSREITLDGSASADSRGSALDYRWELLQGSGAIIGGNTPVARLQLAGSGDYSVKLTVTNRLGKTDSANVAISFFGR